MENEVSNGWCEKVENHEMKIKRGTHTVFCISGVTSGDRKRKTGNKSEMVDNIGSLYCPFPDTIFYYLMLHSYFR